MNVLTTGARDAARLGQSLCVRDALLVACLCARWCDTCEAFREDFSRLAADRPACAFVWIDIEDDCELLGDIDIENFPTLAIYRGGIPLFFGVSLPQAGVVGRTIDSLADALPRPVQLPPAAAALPSALIEHARCAGGLRKEA
ncbi:MAG: thioredoxin family protein [Burkholderiales bacterium]|nr:thioredoxin family protein [Burkholderiales bacterium]